MADVVVQSGDISQTSDKDSPNVDSGPNTSEEDRKKDAVAAEGGTRQRMISETSLSEDDMAELQQTCHDAFAKIGVYLNGELTASLDDYELLEKLNKLSTTKYKEMSDVAKTLITSMKELDGKYTSLQPYLEQIDKVEESVASLEQAAYRLDAYSKKLESRFKRLEKR